MAVRGGKLYGYRLMDIIRGMHKVGGDIIPLKPWPCWTPVLKNIMCLLGSCFLDVITGNRTVTDAACNTLHTLLKASYSSTRLLISLHNKVVGYYKIQLITESSDSNGDGRPTDTCSFKSHCYVTF